MQVLVQVEHAPLAVPVQVELQLEQLVVFEVPVQVELQLEQPVVFAVPEQVELQLEQPVETDEPEQLVEQLEEQDEQLVEVALFRQLPLQSVISFSISSEQLFKNPATELPNATKPKKGIALFVIFFKNSLLP